MGLSLVFKGFFVLGQLSATSHERENLGLMTLGALGLHEESLRVFSCDRSLALREWVNSAYTLKILGGNDSQRIHVEMYQ